MNEALSFGIVVKERRADLGLTQAELARRVGCAPVTIRKIEYDALRPSVQIAEHMAQALIVPEAEHLAFVRMARAAQPPSPLPTPQPIPEEIGQEDLTGRAIRGYELGERIGKGGFGVVYCAVQPLINRTVAVKIILPQYANHPDFIRRFEAEAQLVARLEHPHIVPLYDYWREPQAAYLVMRMLKGGSLQTLLQTGPLSLEKVAHLLEQIGSALHTAHRAGIVHRDIKPENILLDEDGNNYLADFGIAKNLNLADQTLAGEVLGSPAYLSPEQIKAEPVRPQADIYCLGVMLFELLTGEKPFKGPTPIAFIRQHLDAPLPDLSQHRAGLPGALDDVIKRATAKNPAHRYPDVLSLLDNFRQAIALPLITTSSTASGIAPKDGLENPFKGLRAFAEADAADFFGRSTLVQALLTRMAEENDLSRFLAVVGPSGSGKSSVVKAGLIPALRQGGLPNSDQWFIVDMLPGAHPLEELESALLRVAVRPPDSLLSQLREDERGLLRAVRRILPADNQTELVLVIDQFEELFTLCAAESIRTHLLNSLVTAMLDPYSRLRVVITLRADFMHRPLQYVDFGELLRQRAEFVLPLVPDEMTEAISNPAERIGLTVEPGLPDTIIADLGDQPGALPLLQYTLTELFERRVRRVLTLGAYQTSGGVRGALTARAESLYAELDQAGQSAARRLFLRLITLGDITGNSLSAPDTRRRVLHSELASLTVQSSSGKNSGDNDRRTTAMNHVINLFGRHRLLTFDRDPLTRAPTVEVAHEALIREWSRLRGWLDEDREFLLWQQRLRAALHQWHASTQDDGALLRGAPLTEAENWLIQRQADLNETEQNFIRVSLNLREQRTVKREQQRQRELEAAQKLAETESRRAEEQTQAAGRLRQRAVYLTGAVIVAALLAVTAVIFGQQALKQQIIAEAEAKQRATAQASAEQERETAQQQRLEAERQTNLATSRELSLAALTNLEIDPELSILLALQALNTSHTKETEEALHQGIQTSRVLMTLSGHTDQLGGSIYSPDGSYIATASDDGTVKVWKAASGQLLQTMPYSGIACLWRTLMFDASGNKVTLAAIGDNFESVIRHVWDAGSGELLSQKELPISVENLSLALSPDWQTIVAGRENGTAEVWDIETATQLLTLSGHDANMEGVSFNSDGSRLATTSSNGQVRVWDVESSLASAEGQAIVSFETPNKNNLIEGFFSNDGTYLTLIFSSETAELWNLTDTRHPQFILRGHTNWVQYATFRSDDAYLATAAGDGTAKVWDLTTGKELFTLSGHKGFVNRLSFSPNGSRLVTAGQDGTARIWNAQPQAGGEAFAFAGGVNISELRLRPDGQKVALGSELGPATIWDTATGRHLLTLQGKPNTGIYRATFSPDGSRVATAGEDNIVRVWDAETGEVLLEFQGHGEGVSGGFYRGTLDISYSPDGSRLATAGADGIAKVWDAETGKELLVLTGHTAGLHSLAYSSDGRLIATSSDNLDSTVKVWDAQTGEEIYTLGPNPGRAWGLAFSPDSNQLGTGGAGGYIKVWDMTTGKELIEMTGQAATIGAVVFTPDGQRLISGGIDSASIWDIATGTELLNLAPKDSWSIDLTQDGRWLYAADLHTVRVHAVSLEDTVDLAQSRVTRSLTEAECRQYLHLDECPAE